MASLVQTCCIKIRIHDGIVCSYCVYNLVNKYNTDTLAEAAIYGAIENEQFIELMFCSLCHYLVCMFTCCRSIWAAGAGTRDGTSKQ